MKKQQHFSIRLIDGITKVFFWFFAVVSTIFLVFIVLHLMGLTPEKLKLSVELPTSFSVMEEGSFATGDHVSTISISEATGKITFNRAPRLVSVGFSFYVLPLLAALLYILWLFKGFTSNVRLGNVFDPTNIKHLKRLAYVIAGTWFYLQLTVVVYNIFIVQRFVFSGVQFSYGSGSYVGLLFVALFVWVLTHIFQKGAEMEEENRLTV
jgi:hypothetical protein